MASCADIGFIVLRCVQSEQHNEAWNMCCRSITQHYPGCPIVVIDDHSDDLLVRPLHRFSNLKVIRSEFSPGGGEILPYYYYLARGGNWFTHAVILHDSTVVQRRFAIPEVGFRPLWLFPGRPKPQGRRKDLIALLDNHVQVEATHHDSRQWVGCFGGMSVISHDYLRTKANAASLARVCDNAKTRNDRKELERIIGCVFFTQSKEARRAIFGTIGRSPDCWHLYPDMYKSNPARYAHMPLVKIWYEREHLAAGAVQDPHQAPPSQSGSKRPGSGEHKS
jgi:hypothetical protein